MQSFGRISLMALIGLTIAMASTQALAQSAVERGRYLAAISGCSHCHTPSYFFGKPDMARYLGGSDVGFGAPDMGVFVGSNLTPDKETGIGRYTDAQMTAMLRTGTRPDGRILAPMMPWRDYAKLTDTDMQALIAYLRSLKPVKNLVAGPFGPQEKPTVFVMKIVPPEAASAR